MKALFPSFFVKLATATDWELARQIQYLKVENRILRDKLPKRITVTALERQRLLKFGKPLGAAIRALITIVSPCTFTRWLNGESDTGKKASPSDPADRRLPRISANWCYGWRGSTTGATRVSSAS